MYYYIPNRDVGESVALIFHYSDPCFSTFAEYFVK